MASPSGNPNQSSPFELGKLFKPPPNPNPNPSAPPPFPPPSSYAAAPPPYQAAPPPLGPYSYPPATPPLHHHPFLHYPKEPLHRPTISYPAPPPHLTSPTPSPTPNPSPPAGPNAGARLMQLLGNAAPTHLESVVSMPLPSSILQDFPPPPSPAASSPILQAIPSAPPAVMAGVAQPPPARMPSSKMPRGRHLGAGDRAVYDVDSRLQGESQPPQLEVTPITKYTSDPGLVLGRQIAVNRSYIVYGLKLGNIRVLNINTALRSLLRGHTQRVTDMAFFAEDVHLLASASVDGRVFVWKIDEGPDEENKPQITGKIVIAIQIVGDAESFHPRICWHSHKQEILFVGIGKLVLKIDVTKVGRGKEFTAEEPLKSPMEKPIDGVQLIGKHDGDVTDLSISQWMTTRLASASKDGTVKIWDERKGVPLAILKPHDGQAVNSVAFLTSPHRPDHINLITAGPLNREVRIWASESEEGWLLPSDSELWQCNQTLDLRSSSEPRLEEAFFNQVVVLPRASLIILANAKKNAIYAVHIEYGPFPAATRMDYIADFTVTMPILSLTGTNEYLPDGEQVVQVYCVQTMAIQQYALDLAQCLPPPNDGNTTLGRDSSVSRSFDALTLETAEASRGSTSSIAESAIATSDPASSASAEVISSRDFSVSNLEVKPSAPPLLYSEADASRVPTLPIPLDIDLAGIPALKSPSKGSEHAPDTPANNNMAREEPRGGQTDISSVQDPHLMFKPGGNPTHLITPSEIMAGVLSSSENTQVNQAIKSNELKIKDRAASDSYESVEMDVKVVDESRLNQNLEFTRKDSQGALEENKEKIAKNSETSTEVVDRDSALKEISGLEDLHSRDEKTTAEFLEQPPGTSKEEVQDSTKDVPEKFEESAVATVAQSASAAKGKKQKAKQPQASIPSSPVVSPFNSTDSSNEPGSSESVPPTDAVLPQISSMHDMLNQVIALQKDLQKQMSVMVVVPVTKEGKRVEAALGRTMEKSIKANVDAMWARFQEENAKFEKAERDRTQQITNLITSCMNKDLPTLFERALKKEISALAPAVARAMTPVVEKTISSAIADAFQRGVGDKAVNQLEKSVNSKLEATVARQIQAQFQTSGKQALQDSLRSCLESSLIPAFEQSCRVMFEQVDATFQKGMSEHTAAAQQQLEAAHTPLAITLRDAVNSASSITQSLTTELVDGQRKLLALLAAANPKAVNPNAQANNGPMAGLPDLVEAPLDPTKELNRLISERKYEEAFTMALQRSDVSIVSWLCSQVDLHGICSTVPLPLNQGVLLALLQQLACDISNETSRKVAWMTDVAVAINPTDPMISVHVRPIFEQVYNILAHQRSLPSTTASEATNIRLIMHVINSVLMSCK
ncbi:enhancer of mRNA-decapping protein 4-like isoform X3 [Ananas comosus]|uniref:Enhancer of mRNA-decapping protein 4-like isoform X3 n=1 Tax=Ananas comosus TaxID=4615 RepID=A0A6P5GRA4_ANACO|nr:enhancer of mRNA-decapping protein 4-like isoform X3 [Ananas comosus]